MGIFRIQSLCWYLGSTSSNFPASLTHRHHHYLRRFFFQKQEVFFLDKSSSRFQSEVMRLCTPRTHLPRKTERQTDSRDQNASDCPLHFHAAWSPVQTQVIVIAEGPTWKDRSRFPLENCQVWRHAGHFKTGSHWFDHPSCGISYLRKILMTVPQSHHRERVLSNEASRNSLWSFRLLHIL